MDRCHRREYDEEAGADSFQGEGRYQTFLIVPLKFNTVIYRFSCYPRVPRVSTTVVWVEG
jgi:hypothetical protein